MPSDKRQKWKLAGRRQLGPVTGLDAAMGVDGVKFYTGFPGAQLHLRSQADRGVQRRGAVVKQVQWPDVDGAASQVDPRGRRSGEHGRIII